MHAQRAVPQRCLWHAVADHCERIPFYSACYTYRVPAAAIALRGVALIALLCASVGSGQPIGHVGYTSRANCANNESITYFPGDPAPRKVDSWHWDYVVGRWHSVSRGSFRGDETWLTAAHWGEGLIPRWTIVWVWVCGWTPEGYCCWLEARYVPVWDRWYVEGDHWKMVNGVETLMAATSANDCNFDG